MKLLVYYGLHQRSEVWSPALMRGKTCNGQTVKVSLQCWFQPAIKYWLILLSFYICLAGPAANPLLPFISLSLSAFLKHAESQLSTPLLPDIIVLIQAALDLMFVCLERMGEPYFSLIGLTSDVVCVRVYYRVCVVISNPEPKPPPPPLSPPSSPSHCSTPLLLYTSLKACFALHAISQHPTYEDLSQTHTHICLCLCLRTVISHVSPVQWWNAWRNPPSLHPHPPSLPAPIFFPPESGGVISDGELIINSIKWVWLPWQIGLGYSIIINASSAVTMGHSSQMRVTLIGKEDVVTLDRNWGKDWVCFCGDELIRMWLSVNKTQ